MLDRVASTLAVASVICSPAFSDIGFDGAISRVRTFSSTSTVVGVSRAVDPKTFADVYEVEAYQSNLDWGFAVTLDANTGATLELELALLDPEHRAEVVALEQVIDLATIDFMDAATVANAYAYATMDEVISLGFMVEGGEFAGDPVFIVFEVVYNTGNIVLIDAVTGQVFQEAAEGEPAFTVDAMLASIAAAQSAVGDEWTVFSAGEPIFAATPEDMQVSFVNAAGMVVDAVTTPGKVGLSVSLSAPYVPIGRLAEDLAGIVPNLASVTVRPQQAIGAMGDVIVFDTVGEFALVFIEGDVKLGVPDSLWWEMAGTSSVMPGVEIGVTVPASSAAPLNVVGGVAPQSFRAADLDRSGAIDGDDLAAILNSWGVVYPPYDLDGSGVVDGGDLTAILNSWGQ